MSDETKTPLQIALEKAQARADAAKAKAEERLLQALNLAEELAPKLGEQGVKFDVVVTDLGVFAVKAPEYTLAKRFNAIPPEKRTDDDVMAFVSPCVVFPDQAAYRAVAIEHGGITWRLATAMLAMYEGKAVERVGKF